MDELQEKLSRMQCRQRDINKISLRHVNVTRVVAFKIWREYAAVVREERREGQRRQRAMASILRRFINCVRLVAFERWREYAAVVQGERYHEEKRRSIKNQSVMHLMNAVLIAALQQWFEHTAEEVGMRKLMKYIVMKMTGSLVVRSFERWCEVVIENTQLKGKLHKVVQRFLYTMIVQSLEQWRTHTSELKQATVRTGEMMHKMMKGPALEKWREYVAVVKAKEHLQRVMKKMVLRTTNSFVAAVVGRWYGNIEQLRCARAEQGRKDRLVKRILIHMRISTIDEVFGLWGELVATQREQREMDVKEKDREKENIAKEKFQEGERQLLQAEYTMRRIAQIVRRLGCKCVASSFVRYIQP